MRNIDQSKNFKRDLKREGRGRYRSVLMADGKLRSVVEALRNDEQLDRSYHDHALVGDWEGYRECHLAFDFVLVYMFVGNDWLILERLGSYAEIFGL